MTISVCIKRWTGKITLSFFKTLLGTLNYHQKNIVYFNPVRINIIPIMNRINKIIEIFPRYLINLPFSIA